MKYPKFLMVLLLALCIPCMSFADGIGLEGEALAAFADALYACYPKETAGQIEFYQQKPEVEEWYDEAIALFSELYPNITVEQNVQQDASNVLSVRSISHEFTDVWLYWPTDAVFNTFREAGLLLDVSNEPFINYSSASAQSLYQFDGKMYGVPIAMNAAGLVCNMAIFEQYDLELPETWTEFLHVCEVMQQNGQTPLILACKGGGDSCNTMIWGSYVTADQVRAVAKGEMKFSDIQGWHEAVDKIVTTFGYAQANAVTTDYNDSLTDFALGKSAMIANGTWALNSIEGINPEIRLQIIPFPALEENSRCCSGIDVGLSIGAKTEYPEACKAFVNFLSHPVMASIFCNHDAAIPAIKGVEVNDSRVGMIVEAVADGRSFNWPNHFFPAGGVGTAFDMAVTDMFVHRDAEAFISAVDEIMTGVK